MGIVFIETPSFVRKIDRIAKHGEFADLQDELIRQPTRGDIERGTGGARKVRRKTRKALQIQKRTGCTNSLRRSYMPKNRKYRVTSFTRQGKRHVSMMTPQQLQRFRAQRLKEIRKQELGLTQKHLADAIGVNLRTLQDWEMGRSPMPKPVEILMDLMKKMPGVRKQLLKKAA